jgi:hypothetical protein
MGGEGGVGERDPVEWIGSAWKVQTEVHPSSPLYAAGSSDSHPSIGRYHDGLGS